MVISLCVIQSSIEISEGRLKGVKDDEDDDDDGRREGRIS
jgi:hypothetical protein